MMKRNMQFIALALTFLFLNVNGVLAQDRSYDPYKACAIGTTG